MLLSLKEKYNKQVVPVLQEELQVKNIQALPRLEKAVVNVGLSKGLKDDSFIKNVENTLTIITGQKPQPTKARQSIAGFKIREGQVVGMKVTLLGNRMYSFVNKLINIALPRIRDFRGLNIKSVDRQGNMTIGLQENLVFPEIDPDAVDTIHGLEIVIKTTAKTKEEGTKLLTLLGFPFKKK